MDLAGVDKAVLQFGYGNVNEYFADAIRRYPGRFYGMGGPREDTDDPGARADHVRSFVEELGLHGVFYRNTLLGRPTHYDQPSHDPLWKEVARLGVPVWWIIRGSDYENVWAQFTRWCERHPNIPSVIVQGIPERVLVERGAIRLPAYIAKTVEQHRVLVEICYAITHAVWEEYPFAQTNRMVKELYYQLGPTRLVWGSDYPNIERLCTYAQSLNHLKNHSPFISASDMALILGGNLERLLASTATHVGR
jgi:predicted TIM-barrel fold metal-dependent hydrolase